MFMPPDMQPFDFRPGTTGAPLEQQSPTALPGLLPGVRAPPALPELLVLLLEEVQVRPGGQGRLEDLAGQRTLALLDRPIGQPDDPLPLPRPHRAGQALELVKALLFGDHLAQ